MADETLSPYGVPLVVFPSVLTLCRTTEPGSIAPRRYVGTPQAIIRGRGLWLWGCDETTLIHDIESGNQTCVANSYTAIPGLFFEGGMPFDEFEMLLETPRVEWRHERLKKVPFVPVHQRIRMLTTEIGNSISIYVEGPLTHAVVWGDTVR